MSQKSLKEQRDQRLRNLEALVERGFEAYPVRYEATHTASELHAAHPEPTPGEQIGGESVVVAGRVMLLRGLGKLTFVTLQDATGRIQASFQKEKLEAYNALKKIDLGDWLEVKGSLYATRTGELTVDAAEFRPLVKSLRPLPDKHHGLTEKEARYRQRSLDLLVNPEVKRAFELRGQAIAFIRRYLDDLGFLEVETPVLQAVPGGADARP